MMTNKVLAEHQDYDPNSLTSTGGDWTLYADGRVGLTTRSRWAGSRDGVRYIKCGAVDVTELGHPGDDDDAEAALMAFIQGIETEDDFTMTKIRGGHVVR